MFVLYLQVYMYIHKWNRLISNSLDDEVCGQLRIILYIYEEGVAYMV